ncbi:MAG: dephospho-CoA kinase [Chitinophagales bacterium]
MALHVGITGNIGSGKTTVCRLFEILGIPVYYADVRAKELLNTDAAIKRNVIQLLGADVYDTDGVLELKKVASKVFTNPELLQKYNAIVHPAVMRDGESWRQQFRNVPYTLKEAALLFESGSYKVIDKIICVTAPESIRIARVQKRDHVSAQEVLRRIQNQWSEEEKRALSDFLITNDGTQLLIPQVMEIHRQLLIACNQKLR